MWWSLWWIWPSWVGCHGEVDHREMRANPRRRDTHNPTLDAHRMEWHWTITALRLTAVWTGRMICCRRIKVKGHNSLQTSDLRSQPKWPLFFPLSVTVLSLDNHCSSRCKICFVFRFSQSNHIWCTLFCVGFFFFFLSHSLWEIFLCQEGTLTPELE